MKYTPPMDILTLELFDVTLSQALVEVRNAIYSHEGRIRILLPQDEMMRSNLERLLAKEGRSPIVLLQGGHYQMDLSPAHRRVPPVPSAPAQETPRGLKPVLLLRSAFFPGDRALGRQLLLGVVKNLPAGVPWVMLAHDAVQLLEDELAVQIFEDLQKRGISIRVSQESLRFFRQDTPVFEKSEDHAWQELLGKGDVTVL